MLGTRIASLRQGRGLSQAELARKLNISTSAVGMYEQGRREPSVDTLIALGKEFGVSLDYLLSGKPDNIRDVSAMHQMVNTPATTGENHTKEEIVCHLLWALME